MPWLVARYGAVVEAVATLFPQLVEVALHDLRSQTLVAIAGAFSPRTIGEDSSVDMFALESHQGDVIGPYVRTLPGGERLKCITILLRDDEGSVAGMLCLNFRHGLMSDSLGVLQALLGHPLPVDEQASSSSVSAGVQALMGQDWQGQVSQIINQALAHWQLPLMALKKAHRLELLAAMDSVGLFQIRGSADYIARTLGLSRSGLYALLKTQRDAATSSLSS